MVNPPHGESRYGKPLWFSKVDKKFSKPSIQSFIGALLKALTGPGMIFMATSNAKQKPMA